MTFEEAWTRLHPGERPVGWMLREDGARHWQRFHSLPASKRYADSDEERSVLIARHETLALEVLGAGPCWLAQAHWTTPSGEIETADRHDPFRATRQWGLDFSFAFFSHDDKGLRPWRVYAAQASWRRGRFDDLLLSIAGDEAGPTLWMAATGAVFAPYDGGIDLFVRNEACVARLRDRYADWLPTHPLDL